MLQRFFAEISKVFLSAITYIILLSVGGTALLCFGIFLLLGMGAALIATGIIMLGFMVSLCRSVSGGQ